MKEIRCLECNKRFEYDEYSTYKKGVYRVTCPFCKHKFMLYRSVSSSQYYRDETGALRKKDQKLKLSKKERRKIREKEVITTYKNPINSKEIG